MTEKEAATLESPVGSIEVFTLGQFMVRSDNRIISKDTTRSYRLWELFKYLITNRNKEIYSEIILENLWPDQDYANPRHTLRTLVYRLRQILDNKAGADDTSRIKFSHGAYSWNISQPYWLDAEFFEDLCRQARESTPGNPSQSIELYMQAMNLYKGDYLPELAYSEWVIPIRNYYHRYYVQAVMELIELLEKTGRHADVIQVCEKAFLIEFFEEDFHLSFLKALLKEGKIRQAKNHYEYATSVFYRELGVKPSPAMRDLLRLMQLDDAAKDLDLVSIQETLLDKKGLDGAFCCDSDVFRFLYKLEVRRVERTGQSVFLAMITLSGPDQGESGRQAMKVVMGEVQELVVASLRRGDVVTRWNDTQLLVILPGLNYEQAEMVMERIAVRFTGRSDFKGFSLYQDVKPVSGGVLQVG